MLLLVEGSFKNILKKWSGTFINKEQLRSSASNITSRIYTLQNEKQRRTST